MQFTDTHILGMTSMFLQKILDSGITEHRRRTEAAIESWKNKTYVDSRGQAFTWMGDESVAIRNGWRKVNEEIL